MAQRTVEKKIALLRQHDDGVPWSRISAESGVQVRTLTRWSTVHQGDPTSHGLERPRRADRGARRTPPELVEAIEALTLRRPEPTAAFIHRRVSDIAHDRGLTAPSYTSVRQIIKSIDPGLRTLAQHGDAGYRDRFELVFRRSTERPNEQWQADHILLDVAILDKAGAPVRPWLTIILDDYSRTVAGYTLFIGAPTAEQTALALHQAVNRKPNPAWPVAGLQTCSTAITAPTSPPPDSSACVSTPTSNSSTPASASRKAAGRSRGSTAPSPPNCCPTSPGTSGTERTGNPSPRRP